MVLSSLASSVAVSSDGNSTMQDIKMESSSAESCAHSQPVDSSETPAADDTAKISGAVTFSKENITMAPPNSLSLSAPEVPPVKVETDVLSRRNSLNSGYASSNETLVNDGIPPLSPSTCAESRINLMDLMPNVPIGTAARNNTQENITVIQDLVHISEDPGNAVEASCIQNMNGTAVSLEECEDIIVLPVPPRPEPPLIDIDDLEESDEAAKSSIPFPTTSSSVESLLPIPINVKIGSSGSSATASPQGLLLQGGSSRTKRFQCDVCHKAFAARGQLITHLRIHTREKHNSCRNLLPTRSSSVESLLPITMNVKIVSSGSSATASPQHPLLEDFRCLICHKAFPAREKMMAHLRIHNGRKPYCCKIQCSTRLLQSMDVKAGTNGSWKRKLSQNLHLKHCSFSRVGQKSFACGVCWKAYSTIQNLKTHLRTHTGEKPFTCSVCKKAFSQKSHLNTHLRTHTVERPYACHLCTKTFCENGNLVIHLRTHTGEKPYACNVCQKAFSQKSHLNTHLRTHTKEKPYACDVCKKAFSEKGSLIMHLRIHTNEKPYTCHVCQKAFSQKPHLNTHLRTHTREKAHVCNICKKAFTQKGSLNIHLRSHTKEKPFACDICKKAFSERGTLNTHLRTHTKEKPYVCGVCMRAFSQRGNLNTHVRTHSS